MRTVGIVEGLVLASLVPSLVACGASATNADMPSSAPANTPVDASEDYIQTVDVERPSVYNQSSNTVWVSFEGGQTNYQLSSGRRVSSTQGSGPSQVSLRVTRDGGAQMLFVEVTPTGVTAYPSEGQPSCASEELLPLFGSCDGRQFSIEYNNKARSNEEVIEVTLTGTNWK